MVSGQIRILTVDDMPVYREGLGMIIATQPDMLNVAQASDAAEAIAEYRRHQPDVTLMDRRLPSCSGIETMCTIRGESQKAKTISRAPFEGKKEPKSVYADAHCATLS